MKTWIVLLRGVNVGGNNKLPMKALATELESLGFSDVRTYIQSGNVVCRGPGQKPDALAAVIRGAILGKFGFEPAVLAIEAADFAAAAAANPFSESTADMEGRTVHLFFLDQAPKEVPRDRLEALRIASERWQLKGRVLYLHCPEGFGTSKLAIQAERILGVPATARNWRTVSTLLEMAGLGPP
jgi:uncharacterized protein (DUF1697 family)